MCCWLLSRRGFDSREKRKSDFQRFRICLLVQLVSEAFDFNNLMAHLSGRRANSVDETRKVKPPNFLLFYCPVTGTTTRLNNPRYRALFKHNGKGTGPSQNAFKESDYLFKIFVSRYEQPPTGCPGMGMGKLQALSEKKPVSGISTLDNLEISCSSAGRHFFRQML